jgi:hypothetical protein
MRWYWIAFLVVFFLGPLLYMVAFGPARGARGGRRKGGHSGPYL